MYIYAQYRTIQLSDTCPWSEYQTSPLFKSWLYLHLNTKSGLRISVLGNDLFFFAFLVGLSISYFCNLQINKHILKGSVTSFTFSFSLSHCLALFLHLSLSFSLSLSLSLPPLPFVRHTNRLMLSLDHSYSKILSFSQYQNLKPFVTIFWKDGKFFIYVNGNIKKRMSAWDIFTKKLKLLQVK